MDIAHWLAHLQFLLEKVRALKLDYPLGEHTVVPPPATTLLTQLVQKTGLAFTHPLLMFYTYCDGIRLPDVHNGYFIHSIHQVLRGLEAGEPTRLATNPTEMAVVFGSDGGGGRFVMRIKEPGEVLYLPLGTVHNAIFDDKRTPTTILAPDFFAFLRRLDADINAFLADSDDWTYMV